MNLFFLTIFAPILLGVISLLFPKKFNWFRLLWAIGVIGLSFYFNLKIFLLKPQLFKYAGMQFFYADNLSCFIAVLVPIFTYLAVQYGGGFFGKSNAQSFYPFALITLGAANGAVFADNLLVLIVFWGFLGLMLYAMAHAKSDESAQAAKKALVFVGGTDSLMLLGFALLYFLTGKITVSEISVHISSVLSVAAYLLILSAALAKAGAIPLHTWIPDMAKCSYMPSVALLPASLDKLLGIYLIVRFSLFVFKMDPCMNTILMAIGAVTIIVAVMMALVQHDLKVLLGYHAVSQVGYMILGIGTGSLVGIAGGVFHMVNHAFYKSALFFTAGAVEKQAGTTDLDKLGGLIKSMPISFIVCLIASFAISGVPPFNGFYSKWMIYQGIVEAGRTAYGASGKLWVLWLVAAMLGSALTLASFLKVIHAVFLGKESGLGRIKEAPFKMLLPMLMIAVTCIGLGVFAQKFVSYFIYPFIPGISYIGSWSPKYAALLLAAGLGFGVLMYIASGLFSLRRDSSFIGGQELPLEARITGSEFYSNIEEMPLLKRFYTLAKEKAFDLYDISWKILLVFGKFFQWFHNGVIHVYISWCLLGFIGLIIYFMVVR